MSTTSLLMDDDFPALTAERTAARMARLESQRRSSLIQGALPLVADEDGMGMSQSEVRAEKPRVGNPIRFRPTARTGGLLGKLLDEVIEADEGNQDPATETPKSSNEGFVQQGLPLTGYTGNGRGRGRGGVSVTRDDINGIFKLKFTYDPNLVSKVKLLPGAEYKGEDRSWAIPICEQNAVEMHKWYVTGLAGNDVNDLLADGEVLPVLAKGRLTSLGGDRPWMVKMNYKDDTFYARLKAIPGARRGKGFGEFTFSNLATNALLQLVENGSLADPDKVMQSSGVSITFDTQKGKFIVRGDTRAARAFETAFPENDVVALWRDRGLEVSVTDTFSEQMYFGELARAGEGLQPEGMKLPLMPHQAKHVAMSRCRNGYAIFDTPGTGKTASAIGIGMQALADGRATRVIVVVPAHMRSNTEREILRFSGCSEDDIALTRGEPKKRAAAYEKAKHAKWFIVHYDILSRDLNKMIALFNGAYVIADEAHRAKTFDAARSVALRKLMAKANGRVVMTGTPLENNPGEYYNIIELAMPGSLGAFPEFANRYRYPSPFGGWEGSRNELELRNRTSYYCARNTKAQVAPNMPPLLSEPLLLDMDEEYAAILRRVHKMARAEIAAAAGEKAMSRAMANGDVLLDPTAADAVESAADMTAVGMLRRLCCSPRLLYMSEAASAKALVEAGLVPDEDGPKLDWLRQTAAALQEAGERVVVFSTYKQMIKLIAERFREDGIRYVTYTGDDSEKARLASEKAFTTDAEDGLHPTVFLSTDAGAEGLNLGARCATLVNFDLPDTASRLEQRGNRIHRVDTSNARYEVTHLVLAGSIELGVLRHVAGKAEMSAVVLGDGKSAGARSVTGTSWGKVLLES